MSFTEWLFSPRIASHIAMYAAAAVISLTVVLAIDGLIRRRDG